MFGRVCRPVMTKPKPVKAEVPQAKRNESADEGEPMETEKPTQGSA